MAQKWKSAQLIQALRDTNGLVYIAARKVGCAPQTIYNRAKREPQVQRAIDDSRGELIDLGEMRLRLAVMNGDPWAVALVLRTLGRNRGYVERREEDVTSGGQPLKAYVVISPDDWDGVDGRG